ncbi:protein of unknown function [Burkholderia multivorans]
MRIVAAIVLCSTTLLPLMELVALLYVRLKLNTQSLATVIDGGLA